MKASTLNKAIALRSALREYVNEFNEFAKADSIELSKEIFSNNPSISSSTAYGEAIGLIQVLNNGVLFNHNKKQNYALFADHLKVGQWICELDDNGTTDYGLILEVCEIDTEYNMILLSEENSNHARWVNLPIYGVIQG